MKIYKPFLDYLEKSDKVRSEEELFHVFLATIKQHGFDLACFSLLTDHKNLRLKSSFGLLNNFPRQWMRYYSRYHLEDIDPVISYGMHKFNAFSWKEIPEKFVLTVKQKNFLKASHKAGFHHGKFTPLRGPGSQIAGMAIACSHKNAAPQVPLGLITAYCAQFYAVFRRLNQKQHGKIKPLTLTVKEKEILSLVARGKTDPEIGEILSISKHTVNTHLRNIFRKLDTNNRVYAASKALLAALIKI